MLKLELARQRAATRRMDAAHRELEMMDRTLMEVLSDPAFLALLRAHGLGSMPMLVYQRLSEQR
ncbi:hypothetical protein BX591_119141 [Paraburkholderia bryophila]|uniref:Uncharacterized protein n=1 Tax=Paraburkholderia bryophila TaxID=420952 RepID=A0A329BPT6_9BURK|nr:hypothetical protein BX591_119141 [Paraburkholderia bryophila]